MLEVILESVEDIPDNSNANYIKAKIYIKRDDILKYNREVITVVAKEFPSVKMVQKLWTHELECFNENLTKAQLTKIDNFSSVLFEDNEKELFDRLKSENAPLIKGLHDFGYLEDQTDPDDIKFYVWVKLKK